ncbi:hypothetical protein ACT3TZ_11890 [Brachybacterium sp. AOP25-B2-12]|uniref:hypothetical protein n=1 Tax=Brachybacterium sp. AOP25-B2-12 TaxID=3457710 RepID=UPI0040337828
MALIDHGPRPREALSVRGGADAPPPRRRGAARFPTAPTSSIEVRWLGGGAALRATAADHVDALGGRLLDALGSGGADGAGSAALIDVDALDTPRPARGRGRHATVIALTSRPASEADWRACIDAGVQALVQLPAESSHLLDLLAPVLRRARPGLVLGVVGGCGGAGASSTAARLAAAAARSGAETVLVDGDPTGGGIDALVEAPGGRGACWEDLGALGPDDGSALRDGLPRVDGVRILASRGDGPPMPSAVAGALDALTPVGGLVVADLGVEVVPSVLPLLDRLLLVVPCVPHAVRTASLRLRRWAPPAGAAGVLVRRRGPMAPGEVAADLGLELLGSFRDGPAGLVPLLDVRRRGADRACARLLGRLTAAHPERSRA